MGQATAVIMAFTLYTIANSDLCNLTHGHCSKFSTAAILISTYLDKLAVHAGVISYCDKAAAVVEPHWLTLLL